MSSHSTFLKEMGITEWTPRETSQKPAAATVSAGSLEMLESHNVAEKSIHGVWWFFGNEPQGDAKILFQNIIRALGLAKNEWIWKSASESLNLVDAPELPVVAVAFGGPTAQKLTGERDLLPQLRETVLALNTGGDLDIPVVASFELNQVLTKPKEKALLWQDLLLARSVLHNS